MILGIMLGMVVLIGIMVWGLTKMGGEQAGLDVGVEKLVDGAGWVKGEKDYMITVVEFADLQCSACKQAEPVAQQLRQMEGVRYVFRYFPLLTIHKNAWKAAKAMETAKKMDKGWEMMSFLFEKQEDWAESNDFDEKAMGYAKELGLDETEFKKILNQVQDDGVEKQIVKDNALANELNLSGTPTFFVDGEQVASSFVLSRVKEILGNK